MRIAIDCRWIFPKLSGIGQHTANLIKGISELDRENTYLFLKEPLVSYGVFSLKNQFRLSRLLRKLDVDVYHSTNFMIPLFMTKKIKVVITVHDLIPWKFPQYTPRAKKTKFFGLFKLIMRLAVRRADKIIVVSKTTAEDLQECLNVPSEKINVVYNGIGDEFFNLDRKGGEKEGSILFVGRADPYKNLTGLIEAYNLLVKKYNIKHKLLVVGEEDKRYPDARLLVKKLHLEEKVVFQGYVKSGQILEVYSKASVLVMPSFYEGFGLPATEAMACGIPVIVSNTPALKEVVRENAVVIDPKNIEEITNAMYKIISDKDFADNLANKGKEYAKKFTIENMARETVRVYNNLAKEKK
jgi:glycosyltransferase involved in cell wall biosynthesis